MLLCKTMLHQPRMLSELLGSDIHQVHYGTAGLKNTDLWSTVSATEYTAFGACWMRPLNIPVQIMALS